MDVATLILTCLRNNLSIDGLVFRLDEFDTKDPALQLLVESYPERSTWVTRGVYKVEHRLRITIYLKLIRYDLDTVAAARIVWFDLKEKINQVLSKNKFNISGIINIDLFGGWDDERSIAVGRGIKVVSEPIIWKSKQELTCIYYTVQDLEVE